MIAAAISKILFLSVLAAFKTASPPIPAPLEAHVPPPYGVASVSPNVTLTVSIDTPNWSAAICFIMASVPWPCSVIEEDRWIAPEPSSLIEAPS